MKKNLLVVVGLVVAAFAILGLAYWLIIVIGGPDAEHWMEHAWGEVRKFLLANGIWLFAAIAILPGFVLPVSPLLLVAGSWAGEGGVVVACCYSIIAITINLTWTYFLARGPGQPIIESILNKTKYDIPKPSKRDELSWVLVFRLVPGIPFCITNYALGIMRVPPCLYFLVSVPILALHAVGYTLIGAAIFGPPEEVMNGDWKYAVIGVSILLAIAILARLFMGEKETFSSTDDA
ncbi:MAG: VTT domain-containing protein [Opitutales bacterium]